MFFGEALIVAPPFLDICLDMFGAWINTKKSFDWDIILENIAFFAKNGFLKQKLFLVMDYAGSSNECAVFCAHGLLKSTYGKYWNIHI